MTTASLDSLSIYQWGMEATPGTSVPATSKIIVPRIDFAQTGEPYRPQYAKGLVQRYRGDDFLTNQFITFTVPEFPVSYEQLPHWLSMGVQNVTAPTGAGPYTYPFVRDPVAKPLPKTWTIERRNRDGTTNYDMEFPYCFLTSIRISAAQNAPVMVAFTGVCRPPTVAAITAALSFPEIESPPFALTTASIDDAWADLGDTPLSGIVVGWSFEFQTGWYPFFAADGRTDLSFSRVELDANRVNINASIRILAEASGRWQLERTAAQARTLRAIRLGAAGSSGRSIEIDFLGKHTNSDLVGLEVVEDRNEINLAFNEDTDDTNLLAITVINNVATMV